MPRARFTIEGAEELAAVEADTNYSGATVQLFDTWRTPAELDAVADLIKQAAQYLRDNGVQ